MSEIKYVDDVSFEVEVGWSEVPVLVDFTATWCAPCSRLLPIVEQLAVEYADKIKVVKIDVDDSPQTSSRFGIRSVPTLMLFKDGQRVDSKMGLVAAAELKSFLNKHLGE